MTNSEGEATNMTNHNLLKAALCCFLIAATVLAQDTGTGMSYQPSLRPNSSNAPKPVAPKCQSSGYHYRCGNWLASSRQRSATRTRR